MSVQPALGSRHLHVRRSSAGTATIAQLFVRWFNVLSLPALLIAGWSYTNALTAPGNLSVVERSVEWLRGNHYGDTVSQVEAWYYAHHQPAEGGTLASMPIAVTDASVAAAKVAPGGTGLQTGPARPTGSTADDHGITPFSATPVPGEGVWQSLGDTTSAGTAMQAAYLRPDAIHGGVLSAVVRIDQSTMKFKLVPGADEPGNGPWGSRSQLTTTDSAHLLAAFNSGFRIADANGGFQLAERTSGALRQGAATIALAADGTLTLGNWGRDFSSADQPFAVRQNLDLIVDGGQLVDGLDSNKANQWGKTVGNALYVWRSGIGIDAQRRVLYAASEGLSVKSLAALLQRAGAVRAMELDINHSWVSFNTFHHSSAGLIGAKLLKGMQKSPNRYLGPDARDYFAIEARASVAT